MQLTYKQIYLPVIAPPTPPAQTLNFVKPVSYEFRVAETVDNGKVTKVRLQVQIWEHDEFGVGTVIQYWQDVPRAQFDKDGNAIIS